MTADTKNGCVLCGKPIRESFDQGPICLDCRSKGTASGATGGQVSGEHPHWNLPAAVGVWVFFTVSIMVVPMIGIMIWASAKGITLLRIEQVQASEVTLVQVSMVFFAHLLTLFVGWMIVTAGARLPFFSSVGWRWHPRLKFYHILAIIGILYLFIYLLSHFVPSGETDFDKLLQTSQSVRIVIAVLAVLTAPLVEELVYRGILYPAFHVRFGRAKAIGFVTTMFAVVHYPQYRASVLILVSVTILSFVITLIRSYTGQLLPCVVTHLVYNAIGAALILSGYSIGASMPSVAAFALLPYWVNLR